MPQLAKGYATHPLVQYVRSLDGDFLLRTEAAEVIGCAQSLLPYLATQHPGEQLGPTHKAAYGQVEILLYTQERVEQIRQFVERNNLGLKAGKRKMFSAAELQERRRIGGRMRDYRRRAPDYEAAGRPEDAQALREAADELEAELKRTHAERVAELTRKVTQG